MIDSKPDPADIENLSRVAAEANGSVETVPAPLGVGSTAARMPPTALSRAPAARYGETPAGA
ncbi:hypothetical protein THIOKS11900019 [Thiocapsa sp. KS1]|nr:hypothetical protein THIOKS11900019 [Thiocapsa sp. KS1]